MTGGWNTRKAEHVWKWMTHPTLLYKTFWWKTRRILYLLKLFQGCSYLAVLQLHAQEASLADLLLQKQNCASPASSRPPLGLWYFNTDTYPITHHKTKFRQLIHWVPFIPPVYLAHFKRKAWSFPLLLVRRWSTGISERDDTWTHPTSMIPSNKLAFGCL